ncbi:Serine/threonine-protein phosphatase [Pelomyxa schiedti]|nr:Serine/threonine-protein phosphatase [Pelomyxa schiedti]
MMGEGEIAAQKQHQGHNDGHADPAVLDLPQHTKLVLHPPAKTAAEQVYKDLRDYHPVQVTTHTWTSEGVLCTDHYVTFENAQWAKDASLIQRRINTRPAWLVDPATGYTCGRHRKPPTPKAEPGAQLGQISVYTGPHVAAARLAARPPSTAPPAPRAPRGFPAAEPLSSPPPGSPPRSNSKRLTRQQHHGNQSNSTTTKATAETATATTTSQTQQQKATARPLEERTEHPPEEKLAGKKRLYPPPFPTEQPSASKKPSCASSSTPESAVEVFRTRYIEPSEWLFGDFESFQLEEGGPDMLGLYMHTKELLDAATQVLSKRHSLVNEMTLSATDCVNVIGDLHGSWEAYTFAKELDSGDFNSEQYWVYNGDMVGRGAFGLHILCDICKRIVMHPTKVFVNRGNHECSDMFSRDGQLDTMELMFGSSRVNTLKVYCARLFMNLPLATVIHFPVAEDPRSMFVAHGGIEPGLRIEDIKGQARAENVRGASSTTVSLLWNSPGTRDGMHQGNRGKGIKEWGPDVTCEFLVANNCSHIVRSHDAVPDGLAFTHENQVITVFSSPEQVANPQYLKVSGLKIYCAVTISGPTETATIWRGILAERQPSWEKTTWGETETPAPTRDTHKK